MRVYERGGKYSRDFYNVEMLETGMLCHNSIKSMIVQGLCTAHRWLELWENAPYTPYDWLA
jgi:hypothetical protein